MSESKELILVTLPAAADLEAAFISDEYIDRLITDIRQKATSVVGDVNTVKGRGIYISMASTVRRTKTVIDDAGKALVAEMKKRPALVDASRKKVRDALDELAVDIRRPATEWEEAKARVEAEELAKKEAEALAARIETDHEMALLMNKDIDRERADKAVEAERQRVAHEEEIKRQAEEKAKREAAEQAQREIDAAAAREREAILAKERAEREQKEAAEKAERERIAAEQKAEAEKQAAIDAVLRKAQEEAEHIRREAEEKEAARLAELKRIADEEARRAADVEHRRSIAAASMQQRFRLLSTRESLMTGQKPVSSLSLAGKFRRQPSNTEVVMNIQQFNNLKKIVAQFGSDYQLSSDLYDRHVELIDAISGSDLDDTFERSLLRAGVRKEIIDAARESCEFEDVMSTFKRELTGIVARLDLADRIDSARTAA